MDNAPILRIPVERLGSVSGNKLLKTILMARASRSAQVERVVGRVLSDIAHDGDRALFAYTKKFEGRAITTRTVRVTASHIDAQAKKCPATLARTIREAARRIRAYHVHQKMLPYKMTTSEGMLSQRVVALKRVGVYVPGGYTMYPSSVLMNCIPALVAGVDQIVVATPGKGDLDAAIAFALKYLGITEVYRIGGSQAIAALAFGTASIAPVDKIVGPGNAYVAAAKRQVYGTVDIDAIAGPSEVAIVADECVDPRWVALDMLAQAEHGTGDETAVCVVESMVLAQKIARSLETEIACSPVRDVLKRLNKCAMVVFVAKHRAESLSFVNKIAPEHLQIMTKSCEKDLLSIQNSGAVFLGPYTPVALGDYFIGTNHVLPTGGSARFASGLGVDDFMKRISVAKADAAGLRRAAPHVSRFARAERFIHHALSVEQRIVHAKR